MDARPHGIRAGSTPIAVVDLGETDQAFALPRAESGIYFILTKTGPFARLANEPVTTSEVRPSTPPANG